MDEFEELETSVEEFAYYSEEPLIDISSGEDVCICFT